MKLYSQGKNQSLVVFTDGTEVFFSYQTPVAAQINNVFYVTGRYHSQTTSKHISQYLEGVEAVTKDQAFFDQLVTIK